MVVVPGLAPLPSGLPPAAQRYFDAKSTQGALAVTTLQKVRESSISIEVPDVSASLGAVRNYRISREAPRDKQAR